MTDEQKSNILDVAQLAGVSKSTVSRVLNNKGYVAQTTRDSVEDAIKRLNYTPSSFAQNIRTRRSRTIAMMVPDTSNSFYTEVFKAVEDIAYENDYMVIMSDTRRSFSNEKKYADKLLKRNIDGMLYFTQQKTQANLDFFSRLTHRLPIIFMDYAFAEVPELHCVAAEGRNATAEAVKYLYGKGRRSIAYVNLPQTNNITLLRCEGYRAGLEQCGINVDERMIALPEDQHGVSLVDVGFYAAERLMAQNPRIDAIMAASDHLAIGVMKYLKKAGVRIPADVSVMGFDNTDLCDIISPALTTVKQPIKNIGHEAARMLLNLIMGETVPTDKIIFDSAIVERDST